MRERKDYLEKGLTFLRASQLLESQGENVLPKGKRISRFEILLEQVKSPLVYILIFAFLVTVFLREYTDALVILLAVLVNTVLGFWQEWKAERSLEALRRMIRPRARVVRDGKVQTIEARFLVVGDVVILERGEQVPADGVVVEAVDLSMEEAILTGESKAAGKIAMTEALKEKELLKGENLGFMGTMVASGRGKMVVTKTGRETRMGGIAKSLYEVREEKTPLQEQVAGLAKFLAILLGVLCLLIFLGGELQGKDFEEMFLMAVAIAVAAIPEGLVVSLTVILALGMQRILTKKALVRKLLAAETLGSVTTICADKTGTLTEGKMKVSQVEVIDETKAAWVAYLCNNLSDSLEVALKDWVSVLERKKQMTWGMFKESRRVEEIPFDEGKKFMATMVEIEGEKMVLVKGAPEVVLQMTNGKWRMENEKKINKRISEMGEKGLRIIALAWKKTEEGKIENEISNLEWIGVLGLEDPVREGVVDALRLVEKAGIKIKVITGDYQATAEAVIRKLGLLDGGLRSMSGDELEKISEKEFVKIIDGVVLFYRTTPEQKLKIVGVLKKKGEVVAMTGDGVNDAPALKRADIGVVVSEASDVAKETADMVLLDNNFGTIAAAVEEGRGIFENIKKVVLYLLSDTFTEVILVGGSILFVLPLPILPAQILWVNLIEDSLPGMALAFEPKDEGMMKEKPRRLGMPILDSELKVIIFIIGIMTDLILFGLFFFFLWRGEELSWIRTMIFVGLGIDSLFYIFSCKTLKKSLWRESFWNNKFLIVSVLIGFLLLSGAVYLPGLQQLLGTVALSWLDWLILAGVGLLDVGLIEITKWIFIKQQKTYNLEQLTNK